MYTFVTSLNKKYWESTSKLNVHSWSEHLPSDVKIVVYSEDVIDVGEVDSRIQYKPLYDLAPELVKFKEKHKHDHHYNGKIGKKQEGTTKAFKWEGIKFAHKTFAIFAESKIQKDGYLVWCDADVLIHKPIDYVYLEKLFPTDKAITYLGRPNEYDECGLMGYNLNTQFAKDFLINYENEYLNGLEHLRETHDSWIFFQLRLGYEDQSLFHNLNPNPINNKSPFNNSGINEVMVHTKGKNKERIQQKFLKRFALEEARKERQLLMQEYLEDTIPLADKARKITVTTKES